MSYGVVWSDEAKRDFKRLEKETQRRIVERLLKASENPFLVVKRLVGVSLYSLRVGDYRIILSIENKRLIILVIKIRHRKEAYEKLS